jgi:DNA primase
MHIEELIQRFDRPQKSRNGFLCKCPAHEDRLPSLSITQIDDRILMKCFAGCAIGDVLSAVGLSLADLFNDNRDEKSPLKKRDIDIRHFSILRASKTIRTDLHIMQKGLDVLSRGKGFDSIEDETAFKSSYKRAIPFLLELL